MLLRIYVAPYNQSRSSESQAWSAWRASRASLGIAFPIPGIRVFDFHVDINPCESSTRQQYRSCTPTLATRDPALKNEPRIPSRSLVFPLVTFRLQRPFSTHRARGVSNTKGRAVHFFSCARRLRKSDHSANSTATAVARKRFMSPRRRCTSSAEIFTRIGAKVQHLTADYGEQKRRRGEREKRIRAFPCYTIRTRM